MPRRPQDSEKWRTDPAFSPFAEGLKGEMTRECPACGHMMIRKNGEERCGWCKRTVREAEAAFAERGLQVQNMV